MMSEPKPDPMMVRDLVGYGEFPPNPAWPGDAVIAVNFNLNVEGGGESTRGVARALEQNPELARAFIAQGHKVVSHGYRWIDFCAVPEETEREHIRRAAEILARLTGIKQSAG